MIPKDKLSTRCGSAQSWRNWVSKTIEDYAIEYFHAEIEIRKRRESWRELTRKHDGETVCLKDGTPEPCEACVAFSESGDGYRGSLARRNSIKRSLLSFEALRVSPINEVTIRIVTKKEG